MSRGNQNSASDGKNAKAAESAFSVLAALIRTWAQPGIFGRIGIELTVNDGTIVEIVEKTDRKTRP